MTGPADRTRHEGHHGSHDHHRHETHHGPDDHEESARHEGHEPREHHGEHGQHESREDHGGHAHAGHPARTTWRMAASATLHCLTGCAIGEVLGLVIGTALGWATAPTIVLAVALAFFFGYLLTLIPLRRAGVSWGTAIKLALAADTVSIIVMEIVDNGVMLVIPGAMDAGLATGLFWGALAFAFLVAFLVTTPVNKWIIGRGKGHAVVHAYHH
ncbi:DUF4396 domain-containing protein [Planomonospora sp. ID67723]|uniref:DUF4396 domain-containing protein n=1 Tax=Planomonospora sp. ID67723 TaxID=2738134 RepID=UPI001A233290|nr:DUF4396 domain-containing protein [Planomonospora sp. ID67723]MBG0830196.1 DUF4396 domain-containing protein [Planomonospora sp. ID67723]